MSDDIRINGTQHSWGSITVKIGGERFTGLTGISYGDSRERVKAYGMGRHHAPRGRSRGKYSTDPVVLTGWKSTMQAIRSALAAQSPTGRAYGDVLFQITVQYVEADDSPQLVELEDCYLTKNTSSEEEGPDPLKETVEADCMRIRRNGLVLYDDRRGV